MKIIYEDVGIISEVEDLSKKLNAEVEKFLSPEEIAIKVKLGEIPTGIGGPIPKEVIDFGLYLITFFLEGIAWDLIKPILAEGFTKLKSKAKKNYSYFIISDGKDQRDFKNNDYFFIPTNLSKEEFIKVLDETQEMIEMIANIKKMQPNIGSFRFDYSSTSGNFSIKESTYSNEQEYQMPKIENRCSLQNLSACDNKELMELIVELLGGSSKKTIINIKDKILINWREITGWLVIAFFCYIFLFRIGKLAVIAGLEYSFNFLVSITVIILFWLRVNRK